MSSVMHEDVSKREYDSEEEGRSSTKSVSRLRFSSGAPGEVSWESWVTFLYNPHKDVVSLHCSEAKQMRVKEFDNGESHVYREDFIRNTKLSTSTKIIVAKIHHRDAELKSSRAPTMFRVHIRAWVLFQTYCHLGSHNKTIIARRGTGQAIPISLKHIIIFSFSGNLYQQMNFCGVLKYLVSTVTSLTRYIHPYKSVFSVLAPYKLVSTLLTIASLHSQVLRLLIHGESFCDNFMNFSTIGPTRDKSLSFFLILGLSFSESAFQTIRAAVRSSSGNVWFPCSKLLRSCRNSRWSRYTYIYP